MNHPLQARVQAALSGELDFDEVWAQIDAALAQQPDDAPALRLRIQLADAAGLRAQHCRDMQALLALQPHDRTLALDAALLQHRWAFLLVDDDGADAPTDDVDEEADDDDPAEALRAEAMARLLALAEAHADDADFGLALLDAWDEHALGQPWSRLRLALRCAAAHPADTRLAPRLAAAWLAVMHHDPEVPLPEGQVPVGFTVDVFGQMHDALAAEPALAALDDAIASSEGPARATQLGLRAGVWLALSRYADAAADHRAAAAQWQALLNDTDDAAGAGGAGTADDDLRAAWRDQAAQSAQQAQLCAAGSAAIAQDHMARCREAVAGLGQAFAPRDDASPEAAALLAALSARSAQTQSELAHQLDELAPALQASAGPDEQAMAQMRALADTLAGQVLPSVAFAPAAWRVADALAEAGSLDARHARAAPTWRALGLRPLGLVEHLDYSRHFNSPAMASLWQHADGDTLLVHTTAGPLEVFDFETELPDGRQLVTCVDRGRNGFGGGPRIEVLHVDASLPMPDVLALHRARVAWALARTPGLAVRPMADASDFIAMQERQRQAKTAFRLAEGLSDFEARALPGGPSEHFAPLVRAATHERVRAAHQAFLAATGRGAMP